MVGRPLIEIWCYMNSIFFFFFYGGNLEPKGIDHQILSFNPTLRHQDIKKFTVDDFTFEQTRKKHKMNKNVSIILYAWIEFWIQTERKKRQTQR